MEGHDERWREERPRLLPTKSTKAARLLPLPHAKIAGGRLNFVGKNVVKTHVHTH